MEERVLGDDMREGGGDGLEVKNAAKTWDGVFKEGEKETESNETGKKGRKKRK